MNFRLFGQAAAALGFGLLGAWVFKADAFKDAASDIVSALSILNAAIFPTVVLSATVLKAGALSSKLVQRYKTALNRQIHFFFGILVLSMGSILTIIIAQALDWKLPFTIPSTRFEIDWDRIFNFAIISLIAVVAIRMPAFLRALVSLLSVHVDSVAEEVRQRESKELAETQRLAAVSDMASHYNAPTPFPFVSRS